MPPEIPYNIKTIPGGKNMNLISYRIRNFNKRLSKDNKILINFNKRYIMYHNEHPIQRIDEIINDCETIAEENDVLDLMLCNEPEESRKQIFIFNHDGSIQQKNICIECISECLKFLLGNMYDDNNKEAKIDKIYENMNCIDPINIMECEEIDNSLWPKFNFGQLIWNLLEEPKLVEITRSYIIAISIKALHSCPRITFCPAHPRFLMHKPGKHEELRCHCPGCDFILCKNCSQWHKIGDCKDTLEIPPGYRICPNCHKIIEKTEQCNRIHCDNCKKHFC